MNIFGRETVIDARAGKILVESEVIKQSQYSWLKDLLEESEKNTIKKDVIDKLSDSQKSFFSSTLYNDLYKVASDEWQIEHIDESKEKLECSLCGQRDTQKKYYIKNKINEKTLNVGSTCIDNFRDIKSINGKSLAEVNKDWKINQRKNIINNKYPGIIEKIDNWNKTLDSIPTIINENKELEYNKNGLQIRELLDKFCKNGKVDESIPPKINALVCKGDSIIKNIYEDIEIKKKSQWFITKEIKEWCYKYAQENSVIINFLKKDEIVKWRSACRIYEKNLVNMIIEKLKNIFEEYNVKILEFNEHNKTIVLRLMDRNPYTDRIELECPYDNFMKEFGNTIFEEGNIEISNVRDFILAHSRINDKSSINIIASNFKYLSSKFKEKIINFDIEYDELVFEHDKDILNIVSLQKFIDTFMKVAFNKKCTDEEIKKINEYVKNGTEISKKEYKNNIEIREKADKSMNVNYSNFI